MVGISLCMIVKDEEETLARCLSSADGIADEIVIVDTGSTDATKSIAKQFTNRVYDFAWTDDFSAARNYSFSKAKKDYILWLDADDIFLPNDREMMIRLKGQIPLETDVVMVRYNTGFDAQGHVNFYCYRERLVKRSRNFRWNEPVHEVLQTSGVVLKSDAAVTHAKKKVASSDRNLAIYEKQLSEGRTLSPRGQYYYARELMDHGLHAQAIPVLLSYLEQEQGWIEDNISACGVLAACYAAEGMIKKSMCALWLSFRYGKPRPEICCQLGYLYKHIGRYEEAYTWFQKAMSADAPDGYGFTREDCKRQIPITECAECLECMGITY